MTARKIVLKLRGRVRHRDRYGLSYWLWSNTRATATRFDEPRTDDTGVLEQLRRIYSKAEENGSDLVSVDVGAYIGVISLAMSRFGPTNHVIYSIEADELNYLRLCQNVDLHPNNPRIVTAKSAMGLNVGVAEFTRNLDPGTNHLGSVFTEAASDVETYRVPVSTLDEFAKERDINEIVVLKIDVEGADFDVLRGARDLLGAGRIKTIIVEIPLTVELRSQMFELLAGYGFSTAFIVRNSVELTPVSESVFNSNQKAPLNMLAVSVDWTGLLDSGSS